MPEVIWWDVIAERGTHRFAAKVAEEIAAYFRPRSVKDCWWAFISDYARLDDETERGLREHLRQGKVLNDLSDCLLEFLNLYPECPICRLIERRPSGIVDIGYLHRFECRINDLSDNRSRAAVLAQAQVVYMGFVLDKLKVKRGLALAEFPEVEHYPKTEKSERVGASICCTVNMAAGTMLPKYPEDVWVQYFWRRSLDLRPMNLTHLESR